MRPFSRDTNWSSNAKESIKIQDYERPLSGNTGFSFISSHIKSQKSITKPPALTPRKLALKKYFD